MLQERRIRKPVLAADDGESRSIFSPGGGLGDTSEVDRSFDEGTEERAERRILADEPYEHPRSLDPKGAGTPEESSPSEEPVPASETAEGAAEPSPPPPEPKAPDRAGAQATEILKPEDLPDFGEPAPSPDEAEEASEAAASPVEPGASGGREGQATEVLKPEDLPDFDKPAAAPRDMAESTPVQTGAAADGGAPQPAGPGG